MRIVLTIVAVERLRLPYLKLVGAGLLLWIALQLLVPDEESHGEGTVVTGLASGAAEPTGWRFALVLGAIIAYDLLVVLVGVGGILLLRDVFKKPVPPPPANP